MDWCFQLINVNRTNVNRTNVIAQTLIAQMLIAQMLIAQTLIETAASLSGQYCVLKIASTVQLHDL